MKTQACQITHLFALGALSIALLTATSAAAQNACNPAPPKGLAKGKPYYVAFVTTTVRDATALNIAQYNAFVNNDIKNLCPVPPLFLAIASTAATSAKENLHLKATPPIYRVDGERVVEHAELLFGGIGLGNPINIDGAGNQSAEINAWTGTNWKDGSTLVNGPLGADPAGIGDPQRTDAEKWVQNGRVTNTTELPLYAISQRLYTAP